MKTIEQRYWKAFKYAQKRMMEGKTVAEHIRRKLKNWQHAQNNP